MSVPRVPADVLAVQRMASNPGASAWVSANAGSGKTHVLAQRVIRLMLAGTEPAKILCLTYTKAAAANMANRVFETLARWTALNDDALDLRLTELEGAKPSAARRVRARRLFAEALETPGGLKVQTIHAFCTRLLQQFPFEAGVAARFEVLEERAQSELIDRLRVEVLLQAATSPDSALGRALARAITLAADVTFAEAIGEAIAQHDAITAWVTDTGGVEAAIAQLSQALGIAPDETIERIEAEFFSGSLLPAAEWPAVAAALAEGLASDGEQSMRFAKLSTLDPAERLRTFLSIFCTADFKPRKNIVTSAIRSTRPDLFQRLCAEQERVCALLARRRAVMTRDRTAALVTIACAVIGRYAREKNRRGLLDYDDLIDRARDLLAAERAAWVHYKLDLGIDHLLIDEAQDTSPKQWEIIARLSGEFAAGAGARDIRRSIFAVGDEKQSIFSFQGAAPERFAAMRVRFERAFLDAELGWNVVRLQRSFRSTAVVLNAVDTVFGRPQAFRGLTADPVQTVHEAVREKTPGLVEIWPLIEPGAKRATEGWDAPFDLTIETSPRAVLARRIAAAVKVWLGRGEAVGEGEARRAARPGDILVLVRQRGALFEAIIRALKNADVAVAGADRLVLTEHIAVMDLMALTDALLLPEDDLALATVLKSPLFGFDDERLFTLAWGRKGSLRATLRAKAMDDFFLADAARRLDRYAEWSRHETPFAFYARILGAERGRARFYARLGPEAADALDEFLEHALSYERRTAPSLQGFVAWLRSGSTMVKRDMDIARDEVRVMTVHGAKGLEAPIVILADTTTPPKGPRDPRLLRVPGGDTPGAPDRLIWAGRKDDDVDIVSRARAAAVEAAENEYRRLLYVAMTRAADRLVVAGARGERVMPAGCWYQLIYHALVADERNVPFAEVSEEPADHGDGTVWRWRKAEQPAPPGSIAAPSDEPEPPDWLARDAPAERTSEQPLIASSLRETTDDSLRQALTRGTLTHRLLQALPDVMPERRAEAAHRYLARASDLAEAERAAVASAVLRVLEDPRLGALFAPGSRAEVPVVGRIARQGKSAINVSGRIDRLTITAEAVLIADYKTDRSAPQRIEDVPRGYLAQLALYRAVLTRLYPGKAVRAALVWTDVPELMEISQATLDAELTRVTSA